MAVTAESHGTFLAFRRLLYSLSRQLTAKDKHGIIFIHFYSEKVTLENASLLELLCKLESQGIATYNNPNGLLELMKDLKRSDLVGEVKEFMKKKKSRADKRSSSLDRTKEPALEEIGADLEQEDNLELRATLEAALVQATVLLQQMEKLHVCTSGRSLRWSEIDCMVTEASQTAEALAERLRKAEAIGNRQQQEECCGAESNKPTVDSRGYINTFHSDRYIASLLSSSMPLASLYGNSSQRAGSLPAVSEIPAREPKWEDSDNDEDDYETMNPGVVSGSNILGWQEKRSEEHRDYQIPRPHNIKTAADNRPVQYVDVILPPRPSEDPSLLATPPPPPSTTTTIAEVFTEGIQRRHRLSSNKGMEMAAAAAKVASKRWTRIPSEDEPAKKPIMARQKWAKPQSMEKRRNSNQLNNNWPRAYAKTDPVVELTSTIALNEKYPSSSAPVTIPVTLSPLRVPPHGTEDNYTTLHPTQEHEAGYKIVRSHPQAVSLPQLSSLDTGSHYYKPLARNTAESEEAYTSVQHK